MVRGLITGLVFGCADLVLTWLDPVEDDSPLVLLRFYGPMFLVWSVIAFKAARGAGRLRSGVAAGMVVAFATFSVFVVLNFLRVNLFLYELTDRADWQSMMMRFRASLVRAPGLAVHGVHPRSFGSFPPEPPVAVAALARTIVLPAV